MTKQERLEALNRELQYYKTEHDWKMSDSKGKQIAQVIHDFKIIFADNDCDLLTDKEFELTAKRENNICSVRSTFDYVKEPKAARQFSIEVKNKKHTVCNLTIRLFLDESSMSEPDFNKPIKNPYKGMDSVDIEIFERQRSVDYMKEFIESNENNDWNFLCLDNLNGEQILFKTINEMYDKKVHNKM